MVIGVSINIFLVLLFFCIFCFVFNIVTRLNVGELNQMVLQRLRRVFLEGEFGVESDSYKFHLRTDFESLTIQVQNGF